MSNYSFQAFWSEDDEAYVATCAEFSGLSGFGETHRRLWLKYRQLYALLLKPTRKKVGRCRSHVAFMTIAGSLE